MSARTARAIASLLRDEERAIAAGDLAGLERIAARKADLAGRAIPPADASRLRAHAVRNGELLRASLKGVAAALERVKALRGGAPGGTYTRSGTIEQTGAPHGSIRKRA